METLAQSIQNIREINAEQNGEDYTVKYAVEKLLAEIEDYMGVKRGRSTILYLEMPKEVYDQMDESFTSKHCRVISEHLK